MQHAWENSRDTTQKYTSVPAKKAYRGSIGTAPLIHNLSSRWSISRLRPLYPRRKSPCKHSFVGRISAGDGPPPGFDSKSSKLSCVILQF